MSKGWDITCADCGEFILTEKEDENGNIKCVAGSYENGRYDAENDIFYCLDCAGKHGLL